MEVELKILRSSMGVTQTDKIKNECICRTAQFKQFEHKVKRPDDLDMSTGGTVDMWKKGH